MLHSCNVWFIVSLEYGYKILNTVIFFNMIVRVYNYRMFVFLPSDTIICWPQQSFLWELGKASFDPATVVKIIIQLKYSSQNHRLY